MFKNSIVMNLIVSEFYELPSELQVDVLDDVVYRLQLFCLPFQYVVLCSRPTLPMDIGSLEFLIVHYQSLSRPGRMFNTAFTSMSIVVCSIMFR